MHHFTHHKLHISGSGRLGSSERYLLAQVTRWDDLLGQGHAVVGEVNHFEASVDDGVVIDDVRHAVEQFDDQLCHVVAGRCLKIEKNTVCVFYFNVLVIY